MDSYRFRQKIHRLPGKVIHHVPLPEPQVVEEHQSRMQIGEICQQCGYKQVLLVTDKTLRKLGYEQAIMQSLDKSSVGYTLFADIDSDCNWQATYTPSPTASEPNTIFLMGKPSP